jgi:cysteinyl-tRNA synthetase
MLTREQLEQGYNEAVSLAADRFGQINELVDKNAALREALAQVTAEHVRYREREPQWQEEVRLAKQQLTTCEKERVRFQKYYETGLKADQELKAKLAQVTAERDGFVQSLRNRDVQLAQAQAALKLGGAP